MLLVPRNFMLIFDVEVVVLLLEILPIMFLPYLVEIDQEEIQFLFPMVVEEEDLEITPLALNP